MFKVYYKGQQIGEPEYKGKREIKKNLLPILAGQTGKSIPELLGDPEFDIVGEYDRTPPAPKSVERVCSVCGKTFYVASERSLQKTCSPECRQKHLRKYNTEFHKKRYATDEQFRRKSLKATNLATRKWSARKRWQKRVDFAETIMKLAQEPNAVNLIATYLDKNVITANRKHSHEFRCDEEIVAEQEYFDVATNSQLLTDGE